jgi:hypothetical protein
VRSKNAGPRRLTLDIIFRDDADYQRAVQSEALTPEKISPLYGVVQVVRTTKQYLLHQAMKVGFRPAATWRSLSRRRKSRSDPPIDSTFTILCGRRI